MDLVIILDGDEGVGKSFTSRGLGMYCATFLGTTFDVSDISFDLDEYISGSLKAGHSDMEGKKFKINVLDEGRKVLNRQRRNSKSNVKFTNYLSECRSLKQIHIILLPAFHDLDKYIVLWRSKMVFHMVKRYIEDKKSEVGLSMLRGECRLYTDMKAIGIKYEFPYQYPTNYEDRSMWDKREVFTESQVKEYNDKKFKATMDKYFVEEEKSIDTNPKENMIPCAKMAQKLGVDQRTVRNWIKERKIKGVYLGKRYFVYESELEKANNM